MKKSLNLVLILVCVALAFTGIVIRTVLQKQDALEENTVIDISGDTKKALKADLAGFYPGSKQEYRIALRGESEGSYAVTLAFRGESKSASLENYLTVTITANDVTIEKRLQELLEGETLELGRNVSDITITYAMPENTGNEVQGTTADFIIDLTVKNVE